MKEQFNQVVVLGSGLNFGVFVCMVGDWCLRICVSTLARLGVCLHVGKNGA